jgi:hypothetical protein
MYTFDTKLKEVGEKPTQLSQISQKKRVFKFIRKNQVAERKAL